MTIARAAACVALIMILGVITSSAQAIIYFPEMKGYIDPLTKKYTVVGQVVNYNPTRQPVGDLTITIQFLDKNGTIVAEKEVKVAELTPLGEMNVPYLAPIPFKAVLDDVELSQKVRYGSYTGMQFGEAKYKPTDLVLLSKKIYKTDSNEFGNRWTVYGVIKNDYMKLVEDAYVAATLYDAEGQIIGVAGFDTTDKQPARIEPMNINDFLVSTWLPHGLTPVDAQIHAESKNSVLRQGYYFPLLGKHGLIDANGALVSSAHIGDEVYFKSNITSIARYNQEFYWILQIKKLPEEDPLVFPAILDRSVTEHIAAIHLMAEREKSTLVDYKWIPEQEGYYFYEIFIWSSLDNPVPLSYPHTHQFYVPTDFRVLE